MTPPAVRKTIPLVTSVAKQKATFNLVVPTNTRSIRLRSHSALSGFGSFPRFFSSDSSPRRNLDTQIKMSRPSPHLLLGKTAAITGGTTGIGRAIAIEYVRQGSVGNLVRFQHCSIVQYKGKGAVKGGRARTYLLCCLQE